MVSTDSTPPPTEVIMSGKGHDNFIEKLEAGYGEDHHDAARNAALRDELNNPNIHQHVSSFRWSWIGGDARVTDIISNR
jgi:hypothetical protein